MSVTYEAEQKQLEIHVSELLSFIEQAKEKSLNVESFLTKVRKYTDIKELNAEMIRKFVEKIIIFRAEKAEGHKVQRIRIIYNDIGIIELPKPTEQEKTA